MIPAVVQTLAEILSNGTSLISKERIDFSHPQLHPSVKPALNLYCYDVRESNLIQRLGHQIHRIDSKPLLDLSEPESPRWFDLSFLISAWDSTALGEQRLLSEVLQILLDYPFLPEEVLAPGLRGSGSLPIQVSARPLVDITALWRALGVPLRPALDVTVAVPFAERVLTPPQVALRSSIPETTGFKVLPLPP